MAAETAESDELYLKVAKALSEVPHELIEHAPVRTSEEASAVRGTPLAAGAKAMMMHDKKNSARPHVLLVFSAAASVNWKLVRKALGRNYKLAGEDVVGTVCGAKPGAVPPFGSLFSPPVPTVVDSSLRLQGETICFNAVSAMLEHLQLRHCCGLMVALEPQGLRTKSIRIKYVDWAAFERPEELVVCSVTSTESDGAALTSPLADTPISPAGDQ